MFLYVYLFWWTLKAKLWNLFFFNFLKILLRSDATFAMVLIRSNPPTTKSGSGSLQPSSRIGPKRWTAGSMREINFRFELEERERKKTPWQLKLNLITFRSFIRHFRFYWQHCLLTPTINYLLKKKLVQYFSISVISIRRRSW